MKLDFIVVGAGASGLSLTYRLAHSPLRNSSIMLVDRACPEKYEEPAWERKDHTWAFWTKRPTPFDAITFRSWHQLLVSTCTRKRIVALGPYRYAMIRGADFHNFARETLSRLPNVLLARGKVENIQDSIEGASISVGGQEYEGRWVFDSRFNLGDFHPDPRRYTCMKMQFRGWEIETREAGFDPQTATFLDFRAAQRGRLAFFYVLPYSEYEALVEHVACMKSTESLLSRGEQESMLAEYIRGVLGIEDFRVVRHEQGVSPMTDYPFQRLKGRHVMSIGIPAGMLKPTTGFAFSRIQRDSAAIVRSLLEDGHPFGVRASGWGYRLYDSLMLRAMSGYGERIGPLLAFLFRYGSTERILRFLDEQGAPF